jgi:membrane associated rhomboid family serine protease
MFPLGSASRSFSGVPFATVLIILINAAVFYLEMTQGEKFILQWSAVPNEIANGKDLETAVTSMFLHGGWLHIISNMLFLWAFAPLIEDSMGSIRFVIFYLLAGLAAMAAQIWGGDPNSTIPTLGASGAVAGVMGAFLVTYPRDQIRTLILSPAPRIVLIPAMILIGLWIVTQVVSVTTETQEANTGGIAYLAHIGGAVFGAVTGRLFVRSLAGATDAGHGII